MAADYLARHRLERVAGAVRRGGHRARRRGGWTSSSTPSGRAGSRAARSLTDVRMARRPGDRAMGGDRRRRAAAPARLRPRSGHPHRRGLLPAVRRRGGGGRPRDLGGARRHAVGRARLAVASRSQPCAGAARRSHARPSRRWPVRAHERPRRARGRRRDAAARCHLGDAAGRGPHAGARRLARPDGRPAARLAAACRAGLQERGRQGRGTAGAPALPGGGHADRARGAGRGDCRRTPSFQDVRPVRVTARWSNRNWRPVRG